MIVFSEPPAKQEWIHENPWRSHIFLYIFPCSERKNSRKTFGVFSRLCQMMSDVYPSFFVPNVNSPWFLTFSKANLPSKSEADLPEKPTSAHADVQDEVTDGGGLGWSGGRGVGCGVEKTLQGHGSLWVQQGLEDTGRPHLETFTFGKVVFCLCRS